jgi:hypothetical protein
MFEVLGGSTCRVNLFKTFIHLAMMSKPQGSDRDAFHVREENVFHYIF